MVVELLALIAAVFLAAVFCWAATLLRVECFAAWLRLGAASLLMLPLFLAALVFSVVVPRLVFVRSLRLFAGVRFESLLVLCPVLLLALALLVVPLLPAVEPAVLVPLE